MLARSGDRVTTFMASMGLRMGIGKTGRFGGFFSGAHLFPLHSVRRISLIRALFYSNVYYVLSEHHHLSSDFL